jgi:hypothetical protein
MQKRVNHRIFRGMFTSWTSLCDEAAAFASSVGSENLISISHSCDEHDGVIVVWYWD